MTEPLHGNAGNVETLERDQGANDEQDAWHLLSADAEDPEVEWEDERRYD